MSGFNALTQELGSWVSDERGKRVLALQKMFSISADEKEKEVKSATEMYHKYKMEYVKHLSFNPDEENLSRCISNWSNIHLFPASTLEHAPLEAVYIYFDTATYDEIERDEKVSLFNSHMFKPQCWSS